MRRKKNRLFRLLQRAEVKELMNEHKRLLEQTTLGAELLESKIEGARTTRKQPSKGVARGRPKLRKPTGLPSSEYKAAYDAAFHPH